MRPRVCRGVLYAFEVFRFAEGMGISLGMSLSDYAWLASLHFHASNGRYHLWLASRICHTPLSARSTLGLAPWEDDQS